MWGAQIVAASGTGPVVSRSMGLLARLRAAYKRIGVRRESVSRFPLAIHVALWFGISVLVAGLAFFAIWTFYGQPDVPASGEAGLTPQLFLDTLKVALAVVAGLGGVVALVVSYRRQRLNEIENRRSERAERRLGTSHYTERFGAAAAQLGSPYSAIRVAGVYALAGLADDWTEGRQTCIDVLCAYLRLPYSRARAGESSNGHTTPSHGIEDAPGSGTAAKVQELTNEVSMQDAGRLAFPAAEEYQVRASIMNVMREHLHREAPTKWWDLRYNFEGAVFDDFQFAGAEFQDCFLILNGVTFVGEAEFSEAKFVRCRLDFHDVKMAGSLSLEVCEFEDSQLTFWSSSPSGDVNMQASRLQDTEVEFHGFFGVSISMVSCAMEKCTVSAEVRNSSFALSRSDLGNTKVRLAANRMHGTEVWMNGIQLTGGELVVDGARPWDSEPGEVTDSTIELRSARLSDGACVQFSSLDLGAGSSLIVDDLQLDSAVVKFDRVVAQAKSEMTIGMSECLAGVVDLEGLTSYGGIARLEGHNEHKDNFNLGANRILRNGSLAIRRKRELGASKGTASSR